MPRTARPILLELDLDAQQGQSAVNRLSAAIVRRIADGTLDDGSPLPSSRALATETGLPRSTVVSAYEQLISAGYLSAIGGSGTSVAAGASAAARAGAATHVAEPVAPRQPAANAPRRPIPFDLRPGLADTTLVDDADWRRSWRVAANEPVDPDLPWTASLAHAEGAVADYLRATRGVHLDGDIILTPGTSAAFRAIAAAVQPESVHVENPCYRAARAAFEESGVPVVPVPVDADGLLVESLPEKKTLVYVTPAHQFPLGHRLSVERRAALVAWARRTGSTIIEDDYDGEFRYDVSPLPALQSLDHGAEVVVYVGTASKVLASSLQAAWIAAPAALQPDIRAALTAHRQGLQPIVAGFLADMIESGALARGVGRSTRIYRARRTALLEGLQSAMPWCRVVGLDAGLHLVLMLPQFADDVQIATALHARGLHCLALSPYYLTDPRPGLVLGYTRLPEEHAAAAAGVIAETLELR